MIVVDILKSALNLNKTFENVQQNAQTNTNMIYKAGGRVMMELAMLLALINFMVYLIIVLQTPEQKGKSSFDKMQERKNNFNNNRGGRRQLR